MAIGDLLWACPYCGTVGSVRPGEGKGEARCGSCDAEFRRGAGAALAGRRAGRSSWDTRRPADWVDALPALADALGAAAIAAPPERSGELRRDRVEATFAGPDQVVRRGREVLGFRETAGEAVEGDLALYDEHLDLGAAGGRRSWRLGDLTAIQSSSRVVQIKPRGSPVVTFRFRTGSPRLWEELLQHAVRGLYRRQGRGEVREFQPRIVVR